MKTQFTTVKELSGEELKQKLGEGMDAVIKAVEDAVEKGSQYRVSVRDANNDTKLKVTGTVGAFGIGLSMLLLPVFTFLVATGVFIAGVACDYKLVIEKLNQGSQTTEAVKS